MRHLLSAGLCISFCSVATAQWTTDALSVARAELAATSVGSKALFAGGNALGVRFDVVDIYDAQTRTWSTASLSLARSFLAAASTDTQAFFAGGRNQAGPANRVDIYDDTTDTWSTAQLSQRRDRLAGAAAGGKVVFAGGQISFGVRVSRVDIYDSQTSTWTTHDLSVPRRALAATSIGTFILFAGGDCPSGACNHVDIYDTSTDTWSTHTLSADRVSPAATSIGDLAIFAGGGNTADVFDSRTGTWTIAPMSTFAIRDLAATSAGRWALFAGGGASPTVNMFDLSTQTWTTATLSVGRGFHAATSAGGLALFAGGRATSTNIFDTVDIFEPELGVLYCTPAVPNSSGVPAGISVDGSPFVADQDITLIAEDIPAGEFGYFLVGASEGAFQPPGSQGILCLMGSIGRFIQAGSIVQGPSGSLDIDLSSLPLTPTQAIQPGESWNFQCWFRDLGSSNFTDAVSVTFL